MYCPSNAEGPDHSTRRDGPLNVEHLRRPLDAITSPDREAPQEASAGKASTYGSVSFDDPNFVCLVTAYIKATRPAASSAFVEESIQALQHRVACGELDIKDVAMRMRHRLQTNLPVARPAFGDLARACRDLDRGQLSSSERRFVAEMCGRGFAFRPSPRQAAWLADILARLRERVVA